MSSSFRTWDRPSCCRAGPARGVSCARSSDTRTDRPGRPQKARPSCRVHARLHSAGPFRHLSASVNSFPARCSGGFRPSSRTTDVLDRRRAQGHDLGPDRILDRILDRTNPALVATSGRTLSGSRREPSLPHTAPRRTPPKPAERQGPCQLRRSYSRGQRTPRSTRPRAQSSSLVP